jgi:hypothetical protein
MGVFLADPSKSLSGAKSCERPSGPYPSIEHAAADVFGDNANKVLSIGGYVSGWFQCYNWGTSGQGAVLGIMEAYDDAHAKALAQVLTISSSSSVNVGQLPGLPNAYLAAFPTSDQGNTALNAILVRGRMLSYVYTDTGNTDGGQGRLDATKTATAALLKAQDTKLQSFTPTPADKLATLDDDPRLLDGKTVQPAGGPGWYDGGYSAETYPEISALPSLELPLLRANGFREAYLRTGNPTDSNAPSGLITLYEVKDSAAAKHVARAEVSLAKRVAPIPTVMTLPTNKPKKKGQKPTPIGPKGLVCLVSYPTGIAGYHPFRQDCWFAAKQYVLQVDINWGADALADAKTRSKDVTQVMNLINKQLRLTPQ